LARQVEVHAYAHITGGGLEANLSRSLPAHLDALLDRTSWTPPAVFDVLAGHGRIAQKDMDRTFNVGVGMAAVVAPDAADEAIRVLAARGLHAWVMGEITQGSGQAHYR
ncbi:MAG: phosphoribosylformylglycinamidine cyclo-ligase, partial [Nonomuraea sp.]|nr:phosphoribosylformylglycinamidine cyclo-ligase [Nonomuraea sp.]